MGAILLADSGSTKTDWCLVSDNGETICMLTNGINPYLQTPGEITGLLETELKIDTKKNKIDAVYYYGAGAFNKKEELETILKSHFNINEIEVACDMTAAARALCGNEKGIVSILGTGSNSCYYNGDIIEERQVSLGYIAGDEGSGNYMGKRVLQYYAYKTFDEELLAAFEQLFGNNMPAIINKLYKEPFPNRYLATFVQLLKQNRGHFMVENIIEDCLNDFFHSHLMKYRQSWNSPLYFTGSVAFEFADVVKTLCSQYEMEYGDIVKSPLPGLTKYHQALMRTAQ
jgi:N-acetylglucosamine kinase-like BadF-type ATPase